MILLTDPHSSEFIPPEASWLQGLDPLLLLTDVDRFVNRLYAPAAQALGVPLVSALCHRYAVDLNRTPADIDNTQVQGASATGQSQFVSGFHWTKTTKQDSLMNIPMTKVVHDVLVSKYFYPFHQRVLEVEAQLIQKYGMPRLHLDLHSMPSQGTSAHKDNGQKRPDVVISDCEAKSCDPRWKDLAIESFEKQGFQVSYNWPYKGGRMTQQYGQPQENKNSLQVELNRSLYMDESTRQPSAKFQHTSDRVCAAVQEIAQAFNAKKC